MKDEVRRSEPSFGMVSFSRQTHSGGGSELFGSDIPHGNVIRLAIHHGTEHRSPYRRGLTCLQCRPWEDVSEPVEYGLLTLMIGPSGAGKSDWLVSDQARELGIRQSQVVSSDAIRHDMLDDFKDQTQNDRVFKALHKIVKQRLVLGLPTVIDATNLKRKDRLDCVSLANGNPVRYVVIDTPEATVRTRGGWRNELGFDLIGKHFQTFNSQKADILKGDKLPNVEVLVVNA